jgi:hypothetical protein
MKKNSSLVQLDILNNLKTPLNRCIDKDMLDEPMHAAKKHIYQK